MARTGEPVGIIGNQNQNSPALHEVSNRMATMQKKKKRFRKTRQGMIARDGRLLFFLKYFVPGLFAGFGWEVMSIGLHYATYNYVHWIHSMPNETWYNFRYTTLPDPIEDYMGRVSNANGYLGTLDMVAAFFPVLFLALTFADFCHSCSDIGKGRGADQVVSLQTYTKVCFCAGLLFILKGLLGAATTVPDSSGFKVCRDRLTKNEQDMAGLNFMTANHTFWEFVVLDVNWIPEHHGLLRYCSDMMYSGHTLVVTTFALGAYEMLRIVLDKYWEKDTPSVLVLKSLFLLALSLAAIGEQILEIYFVEQTHFHYTMDVLMAIVVVFLVYTNGAICIFSKQWELRGISMLTDWRYSCFTSELEDDDEDFQVDWVRTDMWISRGDVFIPPCCIPCCCLAGREHLYSDSNILEMYGRAAAAFKKYGNNDVPTEVDAEEALREYHERVKQLRGELNLFEGISIADVFQQDQLKQAAQQTGNKRPLIGVTENGLTG